MIVEKLKQVKTISYSKHSLQRLDLVRVPCDICETLQLRQTTSDHLAQFIGICFNHDDRFWILWQISAKATLKEIIFDDDLDLNSDFINSFTHDLIKGLEFLHLTLKIPHGSLNTSTCLVTQHWTLKLCNFGLNDVVNALLMKDAIVFEKTLDLDGKYCGCK